MNLYLNKRIDRTYLDAVQFTRCQRCPCIPVPTARLCGPPLLSTLTKALEFISSALGGCAGRIISSKATDFQAVKCPSRIYQQY